MGWSVAVPRPPAAPLLLCGLFRPKRWLLPFWVRGIYPEGRGLNEKALVLRRESPPPEGYWRVWSLSGLRPSSAGTLAPGAADCARDEREEQGEDSPEGQDRAQTLLDDIRGDAGERHALRVVREAGSRDAS